MPAIRVSLHQNEEKFAGRDQIVVNHLPLVRAIAVRVRENLPVHVDLDDLVHAGVLGLFDAVDKYQENMNVAFHAYAKHRIKGAILDSLREADWASRDMRRRQKQVENATHQLAGELGRSPSDEEVAEKMGIGPDRWHKMVVEFRSVGPVSTTPANEDCHDRSQEFAATPELQPDRICARREMQSSIAEAMKQLPVRYQKVVFLYYTHDMSMKEIGEAMGVNESRVSQIHKSALQKMAAALQSAGIHSTGAFSA